MINPENQEKHLAPVDVKIQNKTTLVTIVIALAIIVGVMIIAELINRIVLSLRS